MRTDRGLLMTYKTSTGSLRSPNNILGECKAFVGERNDRKRQGRLRLRVARGRMRTDRGRLMIYKHRDSTIFSTGRNHGDW